VEDLAVARVQVVARVVWLGQAVAPALVAARGAELAASALESHQEGLRFFQK
jgi:hypothetical protein